MKVLVACEFSGRVRDAFIKKGHDAVSCDLTGSDAEGPHRQCDVSSLLNDGWDLMIAHPPCTYLCVSANAAFLGENRYAKNGNKMGPWREEEVVKAIEFCEMLWNAPIPKICIENPVGVLSTRSRLGKPTQIIQPWMFGDPQWKKTCLWLKGLRRLQPTEICPTAREDNHRESPGPDRWKKRSLTYQGIANAMADQWG